MIVSIIAILVIILYNTANIGGVTTMMVTIGLKDVITKDEYSN